MLERAQAPRSWPAQRTADFRQFLRPVQGCVGFSVIPVGVRARTYNGGYEKPCTTLHTRSDSASMEHPCVGWLEAQPNENHASPGFFLAVKPLH